MTKETIDTAGVLPAQEQTEGAAQYYEQAEELIALEKEGALPAGFDLKTACSDPAFAKLLKELGAAAACRVYDAEARATAAESSLAEAQSQLAEANTRASGAEEAALTRLSEAARQRSRLPKSSATGLCPSAEPDYASMSGSEFRRLEQRMKQAARSGKKTRI